MVGDGEGDGKAARFTAGPLSMVAVACNLGTESQVLRQLTVEEIN